MEHINIAYADSAHRIAVVRIAKVNKMLLFGPAFKLPVLKSNLYRCFYCRRTVVAVKNFVQPFRRNFNQLFGKLGRRLVNQPKQCRMRNFINLLFNSIVNLLAAMPMNIYPQTGNAVVIFTPFGIIQFNACLLYTSRCV